MSAWALWTTKAGATILDSAHEVFASSEMVIKVKEPQLSEWTQLRENQISSLVRIWCRTQSRPRCS